MIGRRLTMRAHVERNVGPPGKDAWNMPLAPDYQPHAVVPCFAWVPRPGADLVDGQKVAIRQDVRMMVALGIDLKAGDQVAQITDTRGTGLHRGPLRIAGKLEFQHTPQEVENGRTAG